MSFTFGPVQTKFLEALESGEYIQAHSNFEYRGTFCALGLANKVCGLDEYYTHVALHDTFPKLGLFSAMGTCQNENIYVVDKTGERYNKPAIIVLNDTAKFTFQQIAAHLRKYGQYYFKYAI